MAQMPKARDNTTNKNINTKGTTYANLLEKLGILLCLIYSCRGLLYR